MANRLGKADREEFIRVATKWILNEAPLLRDADAEALAAKVLASRLDEGEGVPLDKIDAVTSVYIRVQAHSLLTNRIVDAARKLDAAQTRVLTLRAAKAKLNAELAEAEVFLKNHTDEVTCLATCVDKFHNGRG
jgi:hypothetical protein